VSHAEPADHQSESQPSESHEKAVSDSSRSARELASTGENYSAEQKLLDGKHHLFNRSDRPAKAADKNEKAWQINPTKPIPKPVPNHLGRQNQKQTFTGLSNRFGKITEIRPSVFSQFRSVARMGSRLGASSSDRTLAIHSQNSVPLGGRTPSSIRAPSDLAVLGGPMTSKTPGALHGTEVRNRKY
jgi:hypothetical protein